MLLLIAHMLPLTAHMLASLKYMDQNQECDVVGDKIRETTNHRRLNSHDMVGEHSMSTSIAIFDNEQYYYTNSKIIRKVFMTLILGLLTILY